MRISDEISGHFAFGLCVEIKLREFSRKERGGNFTQRTQRRFEIERSIFGRLCTMKSWRTLRLVFAWKTNFGNFHAKNAEGISRRERRDGLKLKGQYLYA